jgi:hypothetical protein
MLIKLGVTIAAALSMMHWMRTDTPAQTESKAALARRMAARTA